MRKINFSQAIPQSGFYLHLREGALHRSSSYWRELLSHPNIVVLSLCLFPMLVRNCPWSGLKCKVFSFFSRVGALRFDLLAERLGVVIHSWALISGSLRDVLANLHYQGPCVVREYFISLIIRNYNFHI